MKIEALNIFPVKSLPGISVQQVEASAFGFKHDRKWMLVDENGKFLSQRKLPLMATISVDIKNDDHEFIIILSKQGFGQIELKTDPHATQEVRIWKDICMAQCATNECNQWINKVLGIKKATLVKFIAENIRQPGEIDRFGLTAKHFTDGAPLLLTNTESLTALNKHLQQANIAPVDMRHFRSNIVVSGIKAFSEHQFSHMLIHTPEQVAVHTMRPTTNMRPTTKSSTTRETIDSNTPETCFRLIDHCQRCSIITVDPNTGQHRPKGTPLIQLAEINAMPDKPKAPAFGVNMCLDEQELSSSSQSNINSTILSVGQRIEFL